MADPNCKVHSMNDTGDSVANVLYKRGSSSVGRATAFQAVGRGFEPRLPL